MHSDEDCYGRGRVGNIKQEHAMIHFYVDIEGTLIDNLFDANYLHHNCANIKNYIHKHDGHPYKVDFFTWGWKTEKVKLVS